MKSKEIIAALTADVERLMKLHDGAMEEISTLRAKSSEQSAKIRSLQEQLKEAKPKEAAEGEEDTKKPRRRNNYRRHRRPKKEAEG
jgi:hypothetical protein